MHILGVSKLSGNFHVNYSFNQNKRWSEYFQSQNHALMALHIYYSGKMVSNSRISLISFAYFHMILCPIDG